MKDAIFWGAWLVITIVCALVADAVNRMPQ